MQSKSSPLTIDGIFMVVGLAILAILFAIISNAQTWDQKDWKHWTAKDAHQVLYSSPWVSTCCRNRQAIDDVGADLGFSASIVSSLAVRQALLRRMELDKRYAKMGLAGRQDFDQRIATCLNQTFDGQIVVSFSFDLTHAPYLRRAPVISDSIRLATSDGRNVSGRIVNDSIAKKCGWFSKDLNPNPSGFFSDWALYEPNHELAFPRFVDGKATIAPDDKEIRIELDYYVSNSASHGGEIDFRIDKLIYQGKPDF